MQAVSAKEDEVLAWIKRTSEGLRFWTAIAAEEERRDGIHEQAVDEGLAQEPELEHDESDEQEEDQADKAETEFIEEADVKVVEEVDFVGELDGSPVGVADGGSAGLDAGGELQAGERKSKSPGRGLDPRHSSFEYALLILYQRSQPLHHKW